MLPVAIVLLLLVLVFVVGAIVSNTEPTTLNIFIAQIPTTTGGLFITGLVAALVLAGALVLLGFGIRHQRHKSADLRSLKRSATSAVTDAKSRKKRGRGKDDDTTPPEDPPAPRRNKTLLDL
ncbi:hypothetical protein ACQCX2_10970 [Propionibacteriaceae bacterium Y1700]|uniref:hypothetical protein n=1 Tax=Microlunatus sp. Y1700 TaxID=3418487 RepID=UPI003DA74C50